MKQPVAVDKSVYLKIHGAEPRGVGSWSFVMGRAEHEFNNQRDADGRLILWPAPKGIAFGQARAFAQREAQRRGLSLIGVAP